MITKFLFLRKINIKSTILVQCMGRGWVVGGGGVGKIVLKISLCRVTTLHNNPPLCIHYPQ